MDDNNNIDVLVNLCQAPDEAIVLILKRVPTKDLVTVCSKVSKQWNRILSQKFFWKEKMEADGYRLPWRRLTAVQSLYSYQMMALKHPFSRNFIRDSWDLTRRDKDCCQMDGRWQTDQKIVWPANIDIDRFDNVRIEVPPVFSEEPEMGPELGGQPVLACLSTGYNLFLKRITIRLADEGLTDEIMDCFRPSIVVSELVAHNFFDPNSEYRMHCSLSRDENEPRRRRSVLRHPEQIQDDMAGEANGRWVEAFRRKSFQQGEDERWHLVRHEFRKYPAGMRYLTLQIYAGSYGVKLARCTAMALCERDNNAMETEEEEAVQIVE